VKAPLKTSCIWILCFCFVWVVVALALPARAAQEAKEETKEAILLVAFGTSRLGAQVAYDNVEKQVREAFPGKDLRWAWTARTLLRSNPEAPRLAVPEALARLDAENVKKVSILSLHIIPGIEYANLEQTAQAFEGLPKGIEEIRLSTPLLHDVESLGTVAELLVKNAPKERKPGEALVFVGHGTSHAAGVYYPAMQYYLHRLDKNAFIGTLDFEKGEKHTEGSPSLEDIVEALKAKSIKKVWLAPFMMVAGVHASDDLFGPEKDRWKQVLLASGIQVEAVDKGLGTYPDFVALWVENLKNVMNMP